MTIAYANGYPYQVLVPSLDCKGDTMPLLCSPSGPMHSAKAWAAVQRAIMYKEYKAVRPTSTEGNHP
jgi:CDP-diacylglycerol pyrophosphatase